MRLVPALSALLLAAAACGDGGADPGGDAAAPDAAEDGPAMTDAALDAAADAATDAPPIAPAGLDPGFGTGGWVAFDGHLEAIAEQPDRKLLVCGSAGDATRTVRLLPGGAPDPSFGAGGVVSLAGGRGCSAIAALADGRVVVATLSSTLHVLSPAGAQVATAPHDGTTWLTSIAPLADGGFVYAGVTPYTVGIQMAFRVTAGRHDATPAPAANFGTGGRVDVFSMQLAFPRARVAWVTTDGFDRVVVTGQGRVAGLTARGVVDGTFAWTQPGAPSALALAARDGAIITAHRQQPMPAGAWHTSVQRVAVDGAAGPSVLLDYCALADPDETAAAVALDSTGRVVVVPVGGGEWEDVRLTRLAAGAGALDPAWGCGRAFTLPAFCPAGASCPGDANVDAWTTAVDALVTAGDAILVAGNQARDAGGPTQASRGFLARVLP